MDHFDKNNLQYVRSILKDAFELIRTSTGIRFEVGSITYDSNEFRAKLTGSLLSETDSKKKDFEKHCYKFGLAPENYGQRFNYEGMRYKISGIRPKAKKYPVVAIDPYSGKSLCFPASLVKQLLELGDYE